MRDAHSEANVGQARGKRQGIALSVRIVTPSHDRSVRPARQTVARSRTNLHIGKTWRQWRHVARPVRVVAPHGYRTIAATSNRLSGSRGDFHEGLVVVAAVENL